MTKLKAVNTEDCMWCLGCEVACAEAFYKSYIGVDLTCIHVDDDQGKPKIRVCVQCGKCAKNCEAEAISKNDKGIYRIDKKKCTGCRKCQEVCPFQVIVMAADREVPSKCIACGICAKACPQGILEIAS
jgi:Fe-S-cluster-containing hydrogenase component 2